VYDVFSVGNFYNRTDSDSRYLLAGIDDQTSSNDDQLTITDSAVVINEDSDDVDFRVESNGEENMLFVDAGNDRIYMGRNATDGVGNARLQIEAQDGEAGLSIHRGSASTGGGAIFFSKSRGATAGDDTVVQSGDELGKIFFTGADGTDRESAAAEIKVEVDGTPGSNDMPGRIVFGTTADGASSVTESMRIDKSGNVGIGTTVGTKALTVARNIGGTEGDLLDIESNGSGGNTQPMIRFGTVPANANTLGRIGFIDIPSYGGGFVVECNTGSVGDSTTEHFRVSKNGDLTATDTSISSNSDSRLKKDISDYTYDLEKFKSYDVKQFNWKNPKLHGDKTNQIGFLAQDVQSIDPQWVGEIPIKTKSEDAQYLDKDLMSLTSKLGEKDAMYISVIQQLIAKNDALEARIKKLEDG